MPEKDKITVALLWKGYAGKVTSVDELAVTLDRDRFEIMFIFLSGRPQTPTWMEEAGHTVFYLSEDRKIGRFSPSKLLRLARILRTGGVDILHCHNHKANLYGALAGTLAGTPVVLAQIHGLRRSRNVRRRLANLFIFRRASRVIGVAEAVKRDTLESNWCVPAEKLSVLENSIAYDRFASVSGGRETTRSHLGLPADAVVYGNVARFGPFKGHCYLVQAFRRVREDIPSAHLVLVGDGPLREKLRKQVADSGLGEYVHFLGQRPDIPEILRALDAFVLPSVGSEGMPRVILEAMAAEVPCIGTTVGGTPEVLSHGVTGWLVPPKDESALAEAMVQVARMPGAQRGQVVKAAQERVKSQYSHEVVKDKLGAIYEHEFAALQTTRRAQ